MTVSWDSIRLVIFGSRLSFDLILLAINIHLSLPALHVQYFTVIVVSVVKQR